MKVARPWPLWDALVKAARRWAEPFGVEVRRHFLDPGQIALLGEEPRYCIDLVHGRLVHGQGEREAIATVSFTRAEVRGAEFGQVFRRRLVAGICNLLDYYAEDRRVWDPTQIKKKRRFWRD